MSAAEKHIQLIDAYLNSELSAAEKYLFEKKLEEDKTFAEEVRIQQYILSGIRQSGRKDMKVHFAALDSWHFAPVDASPTARNTLFSWLTGIAACLVLGAIAYIWFLHKTEPKQLFAHYYAPYPNVIESIERGATTSNARIQAMQAYEYGNYPLAIQGMEEILASQPQDVGLAFYLGVAYLENNQLDKAIKQLEKAVQQPSHNFTTQAMWYLSLAYLKNNDSKQAASLLQTLARQNGQYKKKATRLLEDL